MSHQVKWVKRPGLRPDDSDAAATLSRSSVSLEAASRSVPAADVTGEIKLDDVLAVEVLPGRGPKVSVSATCELQAEDVLAVLSAADRYSPGSQPQSESNISVAPPAWVTDALELRTSTPPAARGVHLGVWIAAASAATCLGVLLAAAAVKAGTSTALVLPRTAHHVASQLRAAERLEGRASDIPVVSLASLASLGR